ncbi:MAG: HAD-IA family hydrolase [Acidobacteriota bacterium]|nr:HAD-IA family hydrolase [Acidobacteriota bacterium]
MNKSAEITCVLFDIGGVLLNNGWDHLERKRAAAHFKLEWTEMEARHRLTFEIYEQGKLTMDEYLALVVFHEKRPFTMSQFRNFMFAQSKPFPKMIGLAAQLKARLGMKIAVVSNEGREMNAYRVRKFELDRLVDSFISSSFVHLRKPDVNMFRLALDIVQVPAYQSVFIDNTPMFVQIAEGLGMRGVLHTGYKSTREKLSALGLDVIG